ncbi:hypothetical protein DFQ26_005392 [Actinomortierella ambigua]|nr:hypothetical protein DFQ26_005392 [Actinomortierella ambigua]
MMGTEQKVMADIDAPEDDLSTGKLSPSLVASPDKELNQVASMTTASLLDIEADQKPASATEAVTTYETKAETENDDAFDTSAKATIEHDTGLSVDADDFGDFDTNSGTTTAPAQDPFDAGNNQDDDEFGDFGGTPAVAAGGSDNHDDGEFGDFGGEPNAGGEDGQDDFGDFGDFGQVHQTGGDDDFGDFGDFTEGGNGGDDFGDFEQDTTTAVEGAESSPSFDTFGDEATAEGSSQHEPTESSAFQELGPPVETAPDFNAVNSRQVEAYVLAQLEKIFPLEDKDTETVERQQRQKETLAQYDTESGSVLAEQELWRMLCEQSMQGIQGKSPSTAPQFQWKYSHLRKEYYASLGLATVNEQTAVPASSIPGHVASSGSASSSPKSRTASPLIMAPERTPERRTVDIPAARAYCNFTRESLGGYSGEEMKEMIARLTELTKQASEELTYWLDQREQMAMDSERYNGMIASLVGRAAKLKESESKQANKSKRLTRSSFNLMSSS